MKLCFGFVQFEGWKVVVRVLYPPEAYNSQDNSKQH